VEASIEEGGGARTIWPCLATFLISEMSFFSCVWRPCLSLSISLMDLSSIRLFSRSSSAINETRSASSRHNSTKYCGEKEDVFPPFPRLDMCWSGRVSCRESIPTCWGLLLAEDEAHGVVSGSSPAIPLDLGGGLQKESLASSPTMLVGTEKKDLADSPPRNGNERGSVWEIRRVPPEPRLVNASSLTPLCSSHHETVARPAQR
jgi:hypothetical protein